MTWLTLVGLAIAVVPLTATIVVDFRDEQRRRRELASQRRIVRELERRSRSVHPSNS